MWLSLAFLSALLLGFYDVAKKQALKANAVPVVLLMNTLFSTLLFSPVLLSSEFGLGWFDGSIFSFTPQGWEAHLKIALKSAIVLSSWVFGYIGIKHLPLTIVGPINATRPVLVLLGALLIFGERLNLLQWAGVTLALFSIFLLSRAGRKEGITSPEIVGYYVLRQQLCWVLRVDFMTAILCANWNLCLCRAGIISIRRR